MTIPTGGRPEREEICLSSTYIFQNSWLRCNISRCESLQVGGAWQWSPFAIARRIAFEIRVYVM